MASQLLGNTEELIWPQSGNEPKTDTQRQMLFQSD